MITIGPFRIDEKLRQLYRGDQQLKLEKIPLDLNKMVLVIGGSLANNKANLVSFKNNKIKIELPSLGYMMLAEVEESNVEIITSTKQTYTIIQKYQYAV